MTDAGIQPLPAVVVNPTKLKDLALVRRKVAQQCAQHGFCEPLWFETTPEDTGTKQARIAVAQGADVVLAMGGDGTVRAVAQGIRSTPVALGLVPFGTGNLLAQNLGLPIGDISAAVDIALIGDDAAIDCGVAEFRMADESLRQELFLVMTGVGFDADIMANTPKDWKKHVGSAAYTVTGLQRMLGDQVAVQMLVDHPQLGRTIIRRRVRTAIVGNCGELFSGLQLMPDARSDDGLLDVAVLTPKGLLGWASVATQIVTKWRSGRSFLEHLQGRVVALSTSIPVPAQVDGDPIGLVNRMRCTVKVGELTVRVPTDDPVDSVLDEATTQRNTAAAAEGRIDLRSYDH